MIQKATSYRRKDSATEDSSRDARRNKKMKKRKAAALRVANGESGKVGWALLWLLGIPLPVLLFFYLVFHH